MHRLLIVTLMSCAVRVPPTAGSLPEAVAVPHLCFGLLADPENPRQLAPSSLTSCDLLRVQVTALQPGPFTVGQPPRFTMRVIERPIHSDRVNTLIAGSLSPTFVEGPTLGIPLALCGTRSEEEQASDAQARAQPLAPPRLDHDWWVAGGWNDTHTVFVVTNGLDTVTEAQLRALVERFEGDPDLRAERERRRAESVPARADASK